MRYFAFLIATAIALLCPSLSAQQAALPNTPEVSATSKPTSEAALPRFELSPTVFFLASPVHNFGFGVRFTYNAWAHISFEAEYDRTPYNSEGTTPVIGGPVDAVFFGVKSGIRWRKWGLFAKFRPGLLSYTGALKGITGTPLGNNVFTGVVVHYGRFTEPAFDAGGGFELYVSRHILVRYDFGDIIVHHGSVTVPDLIGPYTVVPSTSSNFSLSTGIAYRF